MIRRAASFGIQPPSGGKPQPDGWKSFYTPLLPFDSVDKSAEDLLKFYDLLQTEIKDAIARSAPQGDELELVDSQIRLHIRVAHTIDPNAVVPIPDYHIVLDFLAYIVSLFHLEKVKSPPQG